MIDFTKENFTFNKFGGTAKKGTLELDGKTYLIKFKDPIRVTHKYKGSYSSSIFSEDIGCKIYKLLGFETQNTFLCKCIDNNNKVLCCACESFVDKEHILIEFSKCLLSDTRTKSYKDKLTNIEDVQRILNFNEKFQDHPEFEQRFWDMMVVDTLINNDDRHSDNWGFIINAKGDDQDIRLAPVYDCGSAFSPLVQDEELAKLIENPGQMSQHEVNFALPFNFNNERVKVIDFFRQPPLELKTSIKKLVPEIIEKKEKIFDIIENEEEVSKIRKDFMKASIDLRIKRILKPALNLCNKPNKEEFKKKTSSDEIKEIERTDHKKNETRTQKR